MLAGSPGTESSRKSRLEHRPSVFPSFSVYYLPCHSPSYTNVTVETVHHRQGIYSTQVHWLTVLEAGSF